MGTGAGNESGIRPSVIAPRSCSVFLRAVRARSGSVPTASHRRRPPWRKRR
jgi:hypothetical protein